MILLSLLLSLCLEEDPGSNQHLLLQILQLLRLCPPPRLLRGLGSYSILKLFRHLYLCGGTLTDPQEIEGSALPFLARRSFWGEYCGGYECRLPEEFQGGVFRSAVQLIFLPL